MIAFYAESERLVRFLSASDKHKFSLRSWKRCGKGRASTRRSTRAFGTTFFNLEALEKEFQPYAAKDYVETP